MSASNRDSAFQQDFENQLGWVYAPSPPAMPTQSDYGGALFNAPTEYLGPSFNGTGTYNPLTDQYTWDNASSPPAMPAAQPDYGVTQVVNGLSMFTASERPSFAFTDQRETRDDVPPSSASMPAQSDYEPPSHLLLSSSSESEYRSVGTTHNILQEIFPEQHDSGLDGSVDNAMSQHVTVPSTPSQDQVDAKQDAQSKAQPKKPKKPKNTPTIPCPICPKKFVRVQERNRHLELLLPHFIYCPSQGCTWKGRRQQEFRVHWRETRPETEVPLKEESEIYDPKDFVKMIVDGTCEDGTVHVEVVQFAISKAISEAQERLGGGELDFKIKLCSSCR